MSIRLSSLQSISANREDKKFTSNIKDKPISQIYNEHVFDDDAIKKYVMRDAYELLLRSIKTGQRIDEKTADFVAIGMKNWAMDKGVTHYTHWFQPMTGKTAEKHDAFFRLNADGQAIETFDGKLLIKQETDGSSFPNGGLRDTPTARAYTIWDPSSSAFLQETSYGKVLCIPAIFISYDGNSLDLKTPLLKSNHALDKAATAVCKYFDERVSSVQSQLGWEQEYFIIDENLYNARPDLVLCGRTLFGNASARGQQFDDHYFASIPERVHDFMIDFEDDCLMLGIPITTRHNEVAPTQFECAPHYETSNIAADHNQLLMDMIDRIAKRHGLRVLLHEKPYKGINGSGKHNNWSMSTDTGENLFKPSKTDSSNLRFLTFFINVVKAIGDNSELLRASIATSGNEHRLGANEAPPAIISVFTGDDVGAMLDCFSAGDDLPSFDESLFEIDLEKICHFNKDSTDRNRTSPFPFTGNRFEFRAVGSSVNVSHPITVLNTIMADQLTKFKENVDSRMAHGAGTDDAISDELRKILSECQDVIFNGDGYSQEWVDEAARRGLPNVKSTPDALRAYISEGSKELFLRHKVFTEAELEARYNVMTEEYIHKLEMESRLFEEISNTQIVPAVVEYQNLLIQNIKDMAEIGLGQESDVMKDQLTEISHHLKAMMGALSLMGRTRIEVLKNETDYEIARDYYEKIKPLFSDIRDNADALEMLVDDKIWPLPKYRELLFLR